MTFTNYSQCYFKLLVANVSGRFPQNCFVKICFVLIIFFWLAMPIAGFSQPLLPPNLNLGPSNSISFTDYLIPSTIKKVNLQIAGGRGKSMVSISSSCYRYFGGRGALISASFYVGDYSCPTNKYVIKPGGTLRFIVGGRGTQNNGISFFIQGAGGGGSAVLYKAPGSVNWVILMVAGGGGGAGAFENNGCGGNDGRDAELGPDGSGGAGLNAGAGGTNGNGGAAGGAAAGDGGGGGGAFSNGTDGARPGIGGKSGGVTGGQGGEATESSAISYGGFGFGGGGASAIAGGGGGGYSGGGGGGNAFRNPGGGGGGGSFVIEGAIDVSKGHNGTPGEMTQIWNAFAKATQQNGTPAVELRRIYINEEAPASGTRDGTSWANAFIELQDALTASSNTCQAEIWVAKGTYQPDRGIGYTLFNRSHAFVMKSGIAIYGGFDGTETALNQRNWKLNKTYLSGDLAQNNFNYTNAQFANYGENSYHVVKSENTSTSAILDGFLIHSGNANGSFPDNSGGGIYSVNSGTKIKNCTVYFNQAVQGGGLYNVQSSPFIEDCFFSNNKVTLGAAGVYVRSNSYPYFYNCVFQGNYVGTGSSDGGGGGAILNAENSAPEYINCTISGNFANTGGAVYNLNNARPIFYNSIIWQNKSSSDAARIASDGTSGMLYRNCLVQGLNLSGANANLDGSNQSATIFTVNDDPNLAPAAIGILTLQLCSPAIDKGNSGYLANPTDIAGNPRFINVTVDLGAYESQYIGIFYVNVNATGANNGTSWANAFSRLQDALAIGVSCPYQVWVAAGTYRPAVGTNRDSSFIMRNNLAIYGGFAGTETQLSQRNWVSNKTTLSGDIGDAGLKTDNSFNVIHNVNLNNTAVLDGFTISDGYGVTVNNVTYITGGGMFNESASPTINNCIFIGNTAHWGGGMGNVTSSSPRITNSVFMGNVANNSGGAIENQSGSAPSIFHCSISGNVALNPVGTTAGGIANVGIGSSPVISNCIIWGNDVEISNLIGNPQITNSIIKGGYTGTGNRNEDPLFNQQPNAVPGAIGDLRLQSCSPAINAGSNSNIPAGITTDVLGLPRITNSIVDMGAYEFQTVINTISYVYVNAMATGLNNGTSWTNAFTSIQPALVRTCANVIQIWVAKGTYKPTTTTDRNVAFVMKNNMAIYGGFAGNETQLSQRNWRLHSTIISGDIGAPNIIADNSYNIIRNDNNGLNATAILDGFTISGGNANGGTYIIGRGGGIYNFASSPTIVNCQFLGNNTGSYGGAMFNEASTAKVINSVFMGNTGQYGGGLYNESAATELINCTMAGNTVAVSGAAMYTFGAVSPKVTNTIMWGNGSGIQNAGGATPIVTYSIVQGGYTGTGNLSTDPVFVIQPQPGLGNVGDLRLLSCSPALNTGSNAALPVGLSLDLAGYNRTVQTTVDMGAYEVQNSGGVIIYVDANATGGNNGTSWINAFTSLEAALNHMNLCNFGTALTMHLSAGMYTFPVGKNIQINNLNASILGGFPPGGGIRNVTANPVIIKGYVRVLKSLLLDGVRVEQQQ